MPYTKDDLKNLSDYLRVTANEALKQEPPNQEENQTLMEVVRQMEAIRYSPLLFESILEDYEVNFSVMEVPLEEVPLHINDSGIISRAIVKWRCTNAT